MRSAAFREDSVTAAWAAIEFLKAVDRGLERLDFQATQKAQDQHNYDHRTVNGQACRRDRRGYQAASKFGWSGGYVCW
jgi:hypothetical protein